MISTINGKNDSAALMFNAQHFSNQQTFSNRFMIENMKTAEIMQRAMNTLHTAHKGMFPQR
jgi:hypothetical protein